MLCKTSSLEEGAHSEMFKRRDSNVGMDDSAHETLAMHFVARLLSAETH